MPKINTQINVGNIITILLVLFGGFAAWFGIVSKVDANEVASTNNRAAIVVIEEKTDSIDVIEFKVDMNARALARIEAKLDE